MLNFRHLREKKRQKSAVMNLTSSFKNEKSLACPITASPVSSSLSSFKTIINSHEGRSLVSNVLICCLTVECLTVLLWYKQQVTFLNSKFD